MESKHARICNRCKKIVPFDKVRFLPKDSTTNYVFCEDCCTFMKKSAKPKEKSKRQVASPFSTYFCTRCKYKFKVDKSKAGIFYNLKCPYCGKSERLEERNTSF